MMDEPRQTESGLRVLHLEDDPLSTELIEAELRGNHIPSALARLCTQEEFEAALQQGSIDLILSDSRLPGFDTLSALALARQTRPDIPFIFVSGITSPNLKKIALRRGAIDLISKNDLPGLVRVVKWLFSASKRKHRIPPLPEIGMPVIVQCREFRCLGYLDWNGTWRNFEKSFELFEVIDWFDL